MEASRGLFENFTDFALALVLECRPLPSDFALRTPPSTSSDVDTFISPKLDVEEAEEFDRFLTCPRER